MDVSHQETLHRYISSCALPSSVNWKRDTSTACSRLSYLTRSLRTFALSLPPACLAINHLARSLPNNRTNSPVVTHPARLQDMKASERTRLCFTLFVKKLTKLSENLVKTYYDIIINANLTIVKVFHNKFFLTLIRCIKYNKFEGKLTDTFP